MLHQAFLDLTGTDTVAGGGDDVVGSADEPEMSLFALSASVARQQPFTHEFLVRGFGVVPVLQEHDRVRPTDRDLALEAHRRDIAALVQYGDVVTGDSASHAARLRRRN